MTEDEMVGWHHLLNGHQFEQTPGDSEGEGSLACCSPWGYGHDLIIEQQQEGKSGHCYSILVGSETLPALFWLVFPPVSVFL